jgi:hypothetical protein
MDSVQRASSIQKVYHLKNSDSIYGSKTILQRNLSRTQKALLNMPVLEESEVELESGVATNNHLSGQSFANSAADRSVSEPRKSLNLRYIPTHATRKGIKARVLSSPAIDLVQGLSPSDRWTLVRGEESGKRVGYTTLKRYLLQRCPFKTYRGVQWIVVILQDRQYFVHVMTTVANVNSRGWFYLSCFLMADEIQTAFQNGFKRYDFVPS